MTAEMFAQRIRDYRFANRYSLDEMSFKIGVSAATISRWEGGKNIPVSIMVINKLRDCNVL